MLDEVVLSTASDLPVVGDQDPEEEDDLDDEDEDESPATTSAAAAAGEGSAAKKNKKKKKKSKAKKAVDALKYVSSLVPFLPCPPRPPPRTGLELTAHLHFVRPLLVSTGKPCPATKTSRTRSWTA